MSHLRAMALLGLFSVVCLGAPPVPTAATKTFLEANANRKAVTHHGKLVSLYGTPLATNQRQPQDSEAVDAFVASFIANQANCDAMGVDGLQLQFLDETTTPTGRFSTFRYTQVIDGLPVHASLVTLVVYHVPTPPTTTDKISLINIKLTPNPGARF